MAEFSDLKRIQRQDFEAMPDEKDIRFTEKRVDEGWKEHAVRDKTGGSAAAAGSDGTKRGAEAPTPTSKAFTDLITSLGFQAMMHLGEIPNPENNQTMPNLEAAREIIDLLAVLKTKTANHASPEEARLMAGLLAELQMKFSQKA